MNDLLQRQSWPLRQQLDLQAQRLAYIEVFIEFQLARTLLPTEAITAMAATTIKPAIKAYSRTSPPHSSDKKTFSMSAPFEKYYSCFPQHNR